MERCLVVGGASDLPSFEEVVAAAPDTPPPAAVRQGGFNVLVYTSGTTGNPKGVVHPTFDPVVGFEAQKRLVDMWGFRTDDVHLVVGPMYHTMPNAYAAQHLFVGATVVVMPRFDAEECLRLIARERVTTSSMVPAHFIRIVELAPEARAGHDLSSVRKVLHAAAPCPPEVKRRIMEVFPPDTVWEFYGASEGPGTIISPSEWLQRPGSVGRPWPGVTVKVLRRRWPGAAGGRGGHDLPLDPRQPEVLVPQRAREYGRAFRATSSPSATWAGSTRTATCTSPTGAPTW